MTSSATRSGGVQAPASTRVFLDCEFTRFEQRQLISLALVSEAGPRCYVELTDFKPSSCSDFVREVVLPLLRLLPTTAEGPAPLVASAVRDWLDAQGALTLVFDYTGDLELLDGLLGGRHPSIEATIDIGPLTSHPAFAEAQERIWRSRAQMRHHALIDALALAEAWKALGQALGQGAP
ncbi:hypothetical protein OPU71_16760 [Niveibacterium sp. 24ML]|uniref:hypothetical protein n=1 Tax=Niveibacterium sp. 24ML TaxID=2985512 RepID=UPI002270F187|nr:hypothetical protein [Niveibacterium sp. 24ML]MCX9157777.1 hypothetical protein [Niveibacterium sp. 24ML]